MNARQPDLSTFHRTILEIVAQAASQSDAVLYVMDWLNDKDSRCTRTQAAQYIAQAQTAAKRIEEFES